MSICILIPAYNEAENLRILLAELKNLLHGISKDVIASPEGAKQSNLKLDVVVVDDGSTDGTGETAREAGVTLLRHKRNSGKGQALKTGFDFVLEKGYEAVITMDADLQHDVQDVPRFLEAYRSQKADIIMGNRMMETRSMPWLRFWTNRTTSRIISILTGCRLRDTQSGFRLISRDVLEKIKLSTSRFDTESEILIKAVWRGFRVSSVPIRTIYFKNNQSKIKPWVDTARFLKLIFRTLFVWRN